MIELSNTDNEKLYWQLIGGIIEEHVIPLVSDDIGHELLDLI